MENPAPLIFVVEDDPDLSALLVMKLTQEGFAVLKAETGGQALEYLRSNRPSLIVLDILLPDIDGYSILQELSANPATKDIPVIVFSNLADQGSFDQVAAVGKYDYLVKATADLNALIDLIRKRLPEKS